MSYLDTYLAQLDPVLSDPSVMEIAINADGAVWVEQSGQIHMGRGALPALPLRSVRDLAAQIANSTANTFTEAAPLVSATVGYRDLMLRCQVVGTPAVAGGTVIGIRVFRRRQGGTARAPRSFGFLRGQAISLEAERLAMVADIQADAACSDVDPFLRRLVAERLNVIVSGGTSTGKTELGRKLLDMVAPDERIVTIEDSLELLPARPTSCCRPRCACARTASSWANCAGPRPARFSMRSTPATPGPSPHSTPIRRGRRWTGSRCSSWRKGQGSASPK